jgi:hypothetical protein
MFTVGWMAGKIPRVSRTFIMVFIDLRTVYDNFNRRRLYENWLNKV